jgi:hypothetical protein
MWVSRTGASLFGFFFGDWKKKLARKARNKTFSQRGKEELHQSNPIHSIPFHSIPKQNFTRQSTT